MNRKKPILIADDDPDDRELIAASFSEILPVEKLHIVTDGLKLLSYLDLLADPNELPGLILLDLNMPILDGFTTLKKLKENNRFKKIPVVVLSTSKNSEDKDKCLKLGAADYLVKPNTFAGSYIAEKALESFLGNS